MSSDDQKLTDLFKKISKEYKPVHKYDVQAYFYSYKSIKHTIRLKQNTLHFKVSDKLRQAHQNALAAVAHILLRKFLGLKADLSIRKLYNSFIGSLIIHSKESYSKKYLETYQAAGCYFDLDKVFEQINFKYFENKIEKPVLGWSKQNSYRRLGFYDPRRNLLVISKIFDHPKTPPFIVDYLMFHEMLHILIPVRYRRGQKIIHGKDFKEKERQFEQYREVQKWLKKDLPKFARKTIRASY